MSKFLSIASAIILSLLLTGCAIFSKAKTVYLPVESSVTEKAAVQQLVSQVHASAQAILTYADIETLQGKTVAAHAQVIENIVEQLSSPVPTKETKAADTKAQETAAKVTQLVQTDYSMLQQTGTSNNELQKFLDSLKKESAIAAATIKTEREAAVNTVKIIQTAHQAELKKVKDAANNKVIFWIRMILYLIGAGSFIFGIVRIAGSLKLGGITLLSTLKESWVWGVIGSTSFAIAHLMQTTFFYWAIGIIVVSFVGYVAYTVYKARRDASKAETLKTVVTTLDNVYDNASGVVKNSLDDTIFKSLSAAMSSKQKAEIHDTRGDDSTESGVTN